MNTLNLVFSCKRMNAKWIYHLTSSINHVLYKSKYVFICNLIWLKNNNVSFTPHTVFSSTFPGLSWTDNGAFDVVNNSLICGKQFRTTVHVSIQQKSIPYSTIYFSCCSLGDFNINVNKCSICLNLKYNIWAKIFPQNDTRNIAHNSFYYT